MILGFLAVVVRLPQRRAVQDRHCFERVDRVVDRRRSCPTAPTFEWVKALPSIALGRRRLRRSAWRSASRCSARPLRPLKGLTQRNRVARCRSSLPGQQVLPRRPVREGHRPRHRPPDRAGRLLDQPARHRRHRQRASASAAARPATGSTATSTSGWSTARSTAVAPWPVAPAARCNRCSQARSTSTERCCSVPQPSARSCSSSSTARGTHGRTPRPTTGCSAVGTFLPLAGVLVMLFIPEREETLIKQHRASSPRRPRWRSASTRWSSSTTTRPSKLQFFADQRVDPGRSRRPTRSASTASACRCTSCRWSSPCW